MLLQRRASLEMNCTLARDDSVCRSLDVQCDLASWALMETWEVWFTSGCVERHRRRTQLSVEEMETIVGGYLYLQPALDRDEQRDMIVRWDAEKQALPINERATEAWKAALQARGLTSLRTEAVRGDVIVLGYPLLRRKIDPAAGLADVRRAAGESGPLDMAGLDRAAIELVLAELLEIDGEARRTGYRPAVENAIAQYRAILWRLSRPAAEPAGVRRLTPECRSLNTSNLTPEALPTIAV